MSKPVLAMIVGSVREGSINLRLARAIAHAAAERFDARFLKIDDLPIYNQDHENDPPDAVKRLKSEIDAADAVICVTPEYNRSVSPLLKNAIDWASRPPGKSVWTGKIGAIAGATPGAIGTALAQSHLRTIMSATGVRLISKPELYIAFNHTLLDEMDKPKEEGFANLLTAFADALHDAVSAHAQADA